LEVCGRQLQASTSDIGGPTEWASVHGEVAVVAAFDELGALQIELKDKIVLVPSFLPLVERYPPSSERRAAPTHAEQVRWFEAQGARAVILSFIPGGSSSSSTTININSVNKNATFRSPPAAKANASATSNQQPTNHPIPTIPSVVLDTAEISDLIASLRCTFHPSKAKLTLSTIRTKGKHSHPSLPSQLSTLPPVLQVVNDYRDIYGNGGMIGGCADDNICARRKAGSRHTSLSLSEKEDECRAAERTETDSHSKFKAAVAAFDRMKDLEGRINRTSAGALPTPLVIEFLWLKHQAEGNPRLDTLGPKGTGHGAVATMPRSLYSAVMIIPLIVSGLVGGSNSDLDDGVDRGTVSRRGALHALFCAGEVDLPRGPEQSCLSSGFVCCARTGVRCYDGIYAWVVSGAPWYLFHFASLCVQAVFVWYMRENVPTSASEVALLDGSGGASGWSEFSSAVNITSNSTLFATDGATCEASQPLRLVAAGVYSGLLFNEICETVNMAAWLYRAPTSTVTEPLQVSRGSPSSKAIDLVSGLSVPYKLWCCLIAIIPKLILAFTLWYFGGAFILRAENDTELILNCVAVTFINEIDDLMYTVLIPADIDRVLDDLPDIEWVAPVAGGTKQSNWQRWSVALTAFGGQYVYAAVILGMTYSSLAYGCG
jgi:hypothetical protein